MKFTWLTCLLLVSCSAVKPTTPEPQPTPTPAPQAKADTASVETIPDLLFAQPGGVDLLIDLHLPKGVQNPPLVMAIHGGGWRGGDRKSHALAWLANHGYAVACIEYRMSQEATFPAQIHDCKGALRWLRAKQDEYGYDASQVVVGGFSAGGHLAALLGASAGNPSLEGSTAGHLDQSSAVQGIINYYGPTDFIMRAQRQPKITDNPKGIVYRLLGSGVNQNPEKARLASPVTHVGPGDPPILIIHGEKDRQVWPAQSKRLLEVYQEAGLEAELHIEPEKGHGWAPPSSKEKKLVLSFLKKQLKS